MASFRKTIFIFSRADSTNRVAWNWDMQANRRARSSWQQDQPQGAAGRARVACPTRCGIYLTLLLRQTGGRYNSAADHDGGTFRAIRTVAGVTGSGCGADVADDRIMGGKMWASPDGDAARTKSSAILDCGDRAERESEKFPGVLPT